VTRPPTLPRRDLWLLPLISLLTVIVMLGTAEILARVLWPEQPDNSCAIPDPYLGYRIRPNCSSVMKVAEGPWYTSQYNECGYRSPQSCGPVPAGTRRIALLGSSVAEGLAVPYEDTIAARLADDLTAQCKTPVEVQNLGSAAYLGTRLIPRMKEALALDPDAVLLIVTPWDIETELNAEPPKIAGAAEQAAFGGRQKQLSVLIKESRTFTIMEHYLFRNRSFYVPAYLHYGDKADYLRPPFTPAWQTRLQRYDELVGQLSDMAHAAGVPLMLSFVPAPATMVMMTEPHPPAGVDPYVFIQAINGIAARHGAEFVDTSPALREHDLPERLYYQVDGHLAGLGQPIAAQSIAEGLTAGPFPAFAQCRANKLRHMDAAR
jgi:hypothetical protein